MAGPDPDDVAAARARLAAAQAAVGLSQITAPFAGTVVGIYSRPGDSVNSNQTAIAVADLSTLELEVDVSEVDVNNLALGQTATLTLDAIPGQTFTGSVAEVGRMGTSQQGVVTFPVKVVIPSPDPALRPGMTAAVSIVTERRENALLVPNRAIRLVGPGFFGGGFQRP